MNLRKDRRALSLLAGRLLDTGLRAAGYAVTEPLAAKGGKLYFPNGPFVSLSHSGMMAACALSKRPVGLDLQRVVAVHPRLPARICTQEELLYLQTSPAPTRDIIALWALKEAYFKEAGGKNSLLVMQKANFTLPALPSKEAQPSLPLSAKRALPALQGHRIAGPGGWSFWLWELPENYMLALCEQA